MIIQSNGSTWSGQAPDSLETLLDVLTRETLNPTFEKCGNFFYRLPGEGNKFHAFGNFLTVSHVFSIVGDLGELLPLAQALKVARRRRPYLVARAYLRGKGAVSHDAA